MPNLSSLHKNENVGLSTLKFTFVGKERKKERKNRRKKKEKTGLKNIYCDDQIKYLCITKRKKSVEIPRGDQKSIHLRERCHYSSKLSWSERNIILFKNSENSNKDP